MNRIWIAIALSLSAAGCKQGLGDRCEVDADCSSGVCAMAAPKICVSANQQTDQIDASVPCDVCLPNDASAAGSDAP